VGASLLANAVHQSALMWWPMAPSRAGSLPQGECVMAITRDKKRAAPCQGDGPGKTKICHRAVITDNLVIPARSIEAMARATSP